MNHQNFVSFVREAYLTPENFIPLHEPRFVGKEKEYLNDAIDSTFVSSVGAYVNRFEEMMVEITGAKYAVATVNGTSALHIALLLAGVEPNDEVIAQPLTFVATANAISYAGANPVFVDVDKDSMGLSPDALEAFLKQHCKVENGVCRNNSTGKIIKACVPMHTFGFPLRIKRVAEICKEWKITLVEDAAESLGSYVGKIHTGTFGEIGIFSFNGNKVVTCGGGGAIVTDNEELAKKAKYLTTTAKVPHKWEYNHDMIGYNYRMPNLNAALACAQLEMLPNFLVRKRKLAESYTGFFKNQKIDFVTEREGTTANYWLNAIILQNRIERDRFLEFTNGEKVMTRPIWQLMSELTMFKHCQKGNLDNATWLADRVVNIPSSVILH
ncbi:MAG: perosamine synthetase [Arenicella sp.]|jgi:perosamine synthetase